MPIKAIVTDIEGTTSDIDFVHQVLFPYAAKALGDYLRQNQQQEEIATIIDQVKAEIQQPDADLEVVITTLLDWIARDQKITPLKTLQGYIWETGFKNKDFQGHLYQDAYDNLKQWQQAGIKLYVFSSGSVKAQKLLFGYSQYGDLTYLFEGYFDTQIGGKKTVEAYQNIAKAIALAPEEILFLSDVIAELDAAKTAGYHTKLLDRGQSYQNEPGHNIVKDFDAIKLN
ncbi:2,3-diketo-5-methylthio-1-phosphopentane phosphatase [Chondrocystis sp. NIES-4102]|nr:2,3-diketo-5-methylthio-1-phosphopentane phosphatase [Chondrocystis sp. NIES-4102]